MADTTLLYPRGQIALGSGDLIDVTNVKLDLSNGAKQVHTIRQKGAGVTTGIEESTVSFDAVISDQGEERDYFVLLKKGRIRQLRLKVPGRTITINGTVSTLGLELPLDDAIKESITFIGKMDD
jgi:hypothetical protein